MKSVTTNKDIKILQERIGFLNERLQKGAGPAETYILHEIATLKRCIANHQLIVAIFPEDNYWCNNPLDINKKCECTLDDFASRTNKYGYRFCYRCNGVRK